jgi:hypothetical protein
MPKKLIVALAIVASATTPAFSAPSCIAHSCIPTAAAQAISSKLLQCAAVFHLTAALAYANGDPKNGELYSKSERTVIISVSDIGWHADGVGYVGSYNEYLLRMSEDHVWDIPSTVVSCKTTLAEESKRLQEYFKHCN